MWRSLAALGPISLAADCALGNSVGAIESVACCLLGTARGARVAGGASASPCQMVAFDSALFLGSGLRILRGSQDSYLVDSASSICLSQRLSHACLSISNYTVKLRMAH